MKRNLAIFVTSFVVSLSTVGSVFAAGSGKFDLGQREYMDKCAVCHGQSGKGDGGAIDILRTPPTNLTVLSKNNGGVFPFERVYMVVDGRQVVKGHGSRDMPIWGSDYSQEKAKAGEHFFDMPYDMEMYVRARILALIDYLHRLQSK